MIEGLFYLLGRTICEKLISCKQLSMHCGKVMGEITNQFLEEQQKTKATTKASKTSSEVHTWGHIYTCTQKGKSPPRGRLL